MANNKYLDSDLISWTMTPITVGSLLTRIGSASNNLSLNSKFMRHADEMVAWILIQAGITDISIRYRSLEKKR